jgi:SusD family.
MATTFVKVLPMRTTKKAFSKCNSSTWNHKEPMTSGLRWTPVRMPPKVRPSRVTSLPAIMVVGQTSRLPRGSTISSKLSVQLTGNSTHVCTGPSVLMNPTGKISSLVM